MTRDATLTRPAVLFLDTNAVHYARLYLDQARRLHLPPFPGSTLDPHEVLRQQGYSHVVLEDLEKGRYVVKYLRQHCAADPDALVEYSPISRMELSCGLLRGRAILNTAKAGMPDRMWGRLGEREIRTLLTSRDYPSVVCDRGALESEFAEVDIRVYETDPRRVADVWDLSQQIITHVYVETNDSVIYASAVLGEARDFITYDGPLRSLAQGVRNPQGEPNPDVREQLEGARQAIEQFLADRVGIERSDIQLPAPHPRRKGAAGSQ